MAKSQEVVEVKKSTLPTTSLVSADMLMEDTGAGMEQARTEDYSLPFVQILQQLSPQVNKRKAEYVDGAEAGMFLNTVTNELWDGESGVILVPVYYTRNHIEWVTREQGGGFVKDHGDDPSILSHITRDTQGRDILPNGNQIVTTATRYVLVVNPETGEFGQAVVTMSSTQFRMSNKWNTLISMLRVPRPDGQGTFNPAAFYMAYKAVSVPQENDQGSWFGWKIESFKPTLELPNGSDIYLAAREFKKSLENGLIKAKHQNAAPAEGSDAPEGDEIPF